MEREGFFSGYCRQVDGSRMVTVVAEGREITDIDCCWPDCTYASNCPVAEKISQFAEE